MITINSATMKPVSAHDTTTNISEIDDVITEIKTESPNALGMLFLYNEWMQKILLSDGIDADENPDW